MRGVWGNCLKNFGEFIITQYEMLNMLSALRVWGHMWQHKKITFKIDNLAVIAACNAGHTRCKHLAAIIQNIWLVTATWDIEIKSHIFQAS